MKIKYASWSGTRQDLINEIHKREEKDPQAYKMYSKNTGKLYLLIKEECNNL